MQRMTTAQINAKYSNPAKNGVLNQTWYRSNIISVPLPFPMVYGDKEVRSCLIHRMAADSLVTVLTDIWNHYRAAAKSEARPALRAAVKKDFGYDHDTAFYDAEVEKRIKDLGSVYWDHETRAKLQALGLTSWGGSFNFRPVRGGQALSMHAYGIAVDIDPAHNALNTEGRMPDAVVKMFERRGWYWGGRFSRKDPMHFELTAKT